MKKEPLCVSCSWLEHARFPNGSEIVRCTQFHDLKMKTYPDTCNQYTKRDEPTLRDMKDMAWILTQSNQAGYIKPDYTFEKKKREEDQGPPPSVQE